MPRNSIAVLAVAAVISCFAIASTVALSELGASIDRQTYRTKAEFDRIFAEVDSASRLQYTAARHEKLRQAGLKQIGLAPSGE